MGRKSKSDVRKPEILKHLIDVIHREGVEGASFAKIGQSMGVNSSLVVHYFNTKEEMMLALVDLIIEKYGQTYRLFEDIEDPRQRFSACLDAVFSPDWEIGDEITTGVFYACFYLGLRNERINNRMQAMYDFLKRTLIREIENYMAHGAGQPLDAEKLAVTIIAMTEGAYYYRTIMGHSATIQTVSEQMKSMVLSMIHGDQRAIVDAFRATG